jgi:hypothetical protein
MKLSEINPTPLYTIAVPSTGKKIQYRPFLVKEERALLAAYESEDAGVMLNTLMMVVKNCLTPQPKNLTTFDLEYLFLHIRAKSVGEYTMLNFTCEECAKPTPFNVDIRKAEVVGLEKDTVIALSDNLSIKMRYPSIEEVVGIDESASQEEALKKVIVMTMDTIFSGSEALNVRDEPADELASFVERLTSKQYRQLEEFILSTPTVQLNVDWTCPSCKHSNTINLKGLNNFF